MKYFYSHLLEIDVVIVKLEGLGLSEKQKKHLASLLDSMVHQSILDLILLRLLDEEKKVFISKLLQDPEDKGLMEFLGSKIENLEEEIKKVSVNLIDELTGDIEEAAKLATKGGNK